MKKSSKIFTHNSLRRCIASVAMMILLTFLTSINFFIFSDNTQKQSSEASSRSSADEENIPGSPTSPDEKPAGNGISANEEYLHDGNDLEDPFIDDDLFEHLITDSEKIDHIHFERLSPPPERA